MRKIERFSRGMGIGGWLTNYKRFNVLPEERKKILTVGDMEHFQTYIGERDVRYIAEAGFDHVRLGFDQIAVEGENGRREEVFALIDAFIGWCGKYGLRVVLNLHKCNGNYCDVREAVSLFDSAELQNKFVDLWLYIEDRYHDKPDVMFELLNEVTERGAAWNGLAERTIRALRAKNAARYIIVGPSRWNSADELPNLRVYEDDRVIYTFHMYSPHEFTHQRGVLQASQCFYNREMPYPGSIERYRHYRAAVEGDQDPYPGYERMDRAYLYDRLAPAANFLRDHPEKILWCGEFGTIRHAKLEWRVAYMRDVIAFLKAHDVPYAVWNYLSTPNDGNRFSLVDDDSREFLSEELKNVLLGRF